MNEQYENDPVLRKWVNPYYLKPSVIEAIRSSCLSKPHFNYAALDNFFNRDVLDEFIGQYKKLRFPTRRSPLPYDSLAVFDKEGHIIGSELFHHKAWHMLASQYVGTPLRHAGEKVGVKAHVIPKCGKGFWIHTDRTEQKNAAMAALIYLNKNWKEDQGSMLQLWTRINHLKPIDKVDYSWDEYRKERLEFLNERYSLTIDLVTNEGHEPAELFLIDQITPEYNRLVLADFTRDPCYHSVTPANGRERAGVLLWLF